MARGSPLSSDLASALACFKVKCGGLSGTSGSVNASIRGILFRFHLDPYGREALRVATARDAAIAIAPTMESDCVRLRMKA